MTKTAKRKRVSRAARAEAKEAVAFLFGHGVKPKADPIFRLIADHEAACAAFEKTRKVVGNMLPSDLRYKAAQKSDSKASAREIKALVALPGCRPTTLHGVLTALEHIAQPEWLAKGKNYTKETVLSAITHYDEAAVGEELANLGKSFPLRLAAALREIIGTEGGVKP
jgi:hypothetical protein